MANLGVAVIKVRKGRWNRHGGYTAAAYDGRRKVGQIQATKQRAGGKDVLSVHFIEVENRRQGVGTALYEQAAQDACAGGMLLASRGYARNARSGGFWAKQRRKGRTVQLTEDTEAVRCAYAPNLSGAAKRRR